MKIEIPGFLRHLPVYSGLPVAYTAFVDQSGKPDFRVTDRAKAIECYKKRLCGICGNQMLNQYWFIGGEKSMESGTFTDAPMHKACARFSMETCPYLTGKLQGHRETGLPTTATIIINPTMSTERPKRMAMRRAMHYNMSIASGHVVFTVTRWHGSPHWF